MRLPRGSRIRQEALERTAASMAELINKRDWSGHEKLGDDVEFHPLKDFPISGVRHGGSGIRSYLEELIEMFPDYKVEPVGVEDPGDETFVFHWRSTGTGGSSGAPVEVYVKQTFELRDGRLMRVTEELEPPPKDGASAQNRKD